MLESWRWFGPSDSVSLENIIQAGAKAVVTSLHHIAVGDVWSLDEINKRKDLIEAKGLQWAVVESVPLHNDIKLRKGNYQQYIKAYCQTIRNLAAAGVNTICSQLYACSGLDPHKFNVQACQ